MHRVLLLVAIGGCLGWTDVFAQTADSVRIIVPGGERTVRFVPPRPGGRRIIIVPGASVKEATIVPAARPGPAAGVLLQEQAETLRALAELSERVGRVESALSSATASDQAQHQGLADSLRVWLKALEQGPSASTPGLGEALVLGQTAAADDSTEVDVAAAGAVPREDRQTEPSPPSGQEALLPPTPEVIERIMLDRGLFRAVQVVFELDSARLLPHAHPTLDAVAEVMARNPELQLRIVGHTDAIGAAPYNLNLSMNRATAVQTYLMGKGVAGHRLSAEGRGEQEPIADNSYATGRVLNRRVEFVVR